MWRYGAAVLSHLLLVVAWYLFVVIGKVPSFVMPTPYATIHALLVPVSYTHLDVYKRQH